jgi:hypothetical protein
MALRGCMPWPITGMALSHASGRPNTWATNCGDWGPGMAAGMSVSPEELRVTVKAFEAAGADELIFDPSSSTMDQLEGLAEAVLS